jgi:hypothetical protein
MQNLFPASATNSTECGDEQTVAMKHSFAIMKYATLDPKSKLMLVHHPL